MVGSVALAFVLLTSPAAPQAAKTRPGPGTTQLGTNLNGLVDWNSELPFVDVFRTARTWISQKDGQPWGQGGTLAQDADGWVTSLQPGQYAETPMCTIDGGHYPAGNYTLLYDGDGDFEFWGSAHAVSSAPGRMVANVIPSQGTIWLRLRRVNPADSPRNIRLIMPGFEATYQAQPYHPNFINRWKGFSVIRFMDWMDTNGNLTVSWSDRAKPSDATTTLRGASIELMCDLANRTGAEPWFCIPAHADDTYVREFAKLVKAKLDFRLKPYVEYSNEVWNGQFEQNSYAASMGQAQGLDNTPWGNAWRYTGRRSKQIFAIWKDVFGTRPMVRVVGTQAANSFVTEQILMQDEVWKTTDAVAIAPYFGPAFFPDPTNPINSTAVSKWSVTQLLDYVQANTLPEAIGWMKAQKAVANRYKLALVAYEGGQHLVGAGGGENNDALTTLLQNANASPRMGQVYDQYLAAWKANGGGTFCHFSSTGAWSKWGSWGTNQWYDDTVTSSPKLAALYRWRAALMAR